MGLNKMIKSLFPDKYLSDAAKKKNMRFSPGTDQAQLARFAHVNALRELTDNAVQLLSEQITTSESSATLPNSFIQKTATTITYEDGTVLQGWKLVGNQSINSSTGNSYNQGTIRIASPDGITDGGFFVAYATTGSVKCVDTTGAQDIEIVNPFASGADLADGTGAAIQSDYVGLYFTNNPVNPDLSKDLDITLIAIPDVTATGASTAEAYYQFEFLCYGEVTPVLV